MFCNKGPLEHVFDDTVRRKDDRHENESYFSRNTSNPQEDGTQTSRKSIFN
jgi:hypothetical protein